MSSNKALFGLFVVSVGINSFGAFKASQPPWPGTIVRIGAAFGILGLVALADEHIAELLGGGFVLASLVNVASKQSPTGKWSATFGAVAPAPGPNFPYYALSWGAAPTQ